MDERNEVVEMDRGSRSALIVALESRETDPRKPVSSKRGASVYGTATGKHGMNSESLTNVLTQQWRIVTGSKTVKPRNRMPETGASGSVGAPLEESGALPGNRVYAAEQDEGRLEDARRRKLTKVHVQLEYLTLDGCAHGQPFEIS
jgi:hypothetical protein